MKKVIWKSLAVALVLGCGVLAALVWADERIEMSTYVPAASNSWDRVHANRATIGTPYSLINPAEPNPPDGTLLVANNLGINTPAPRAPLHVNGRMQISPGHDFASGFDELEITDVRTGGGGILAFNARGGGSTGSTRLTDSQDIIAVGGIGLAFRVADNGEAPYVNDIEAMIIRTSGNVGIGIHNPTAMLDVNGTHVFKAMANTEIKAAIGNDTRKYIVQRDPGNGVVYCYYFDGTSHRRIILGTGPGETY